MEVLDKVKNINLEEALLDVNKLGELYEVFKEIRSFEKELEDKMKATLNAGGKVKGYKLVEGKNKRDWNLKGEALKAEVIRRGLDPNLLFETKPISVPKFAKLVGHKNVDGLVKYSKQAPVMAKADDNRKEVIVGGQVTADDFAGL